MKTLKLVEVDSNTGISEEDILLEKLGGHNMNEAELGSADYWKTEGINEARDEAYRTVRDYLEEKGWENDLTSLNTVYETN